MHENLRLNQLKTSCLFIPNYLILGTLAFECILSQHKTKNTDIAVAMLRIFKKVMAQKTPNESKYLGLTMHQPKISIQKLKSNPYQRKISKLELSICEEFNKNILNH